MKWSGCLAVFSWWRPTDGATQLGVRVDTCAPALYSLPPAGSWVWLYTLTFRCSTSVRGSVQMRCDAVASPWPHESHRRSTASASNHRVSSLRSGAAEAEAEEGLPPDPDDDPAASPGVSTSSDRCVNVSSTVDWWWHRGHSSVCCTPQRKCDATGHARADCDCDCGGGIGASPSASSRDDGGGGLAFFFALVAAVAGAVMEEVGEAGGKCASISSSNSSSSEQRNSCASCVSVKRADPRGWVRGFVYEAPSWDTAATRWLQDGISVPKVQSAPSCV